jgi:hypothetical protein
MPPKPVTGRDHEAGRQSVDTGDREILNTADMLADGFFQHFDGDLQELADKASLNLPPEQTFVAGDVSSLTSSAASKGPSNLERALLTLMDVRDELVSKYSQVAGNEGMSLVFTACIRKLEKHMSKLGSDVEPFNPKKYGSGLGAAPAGDILENARKVVGNTKEHYRLHKVAKIYAGRATDGRPGIGIEIEGVDGDKPFSIIGRVVPKTDFSGNEVVDYIKDDGKGMMSVKALKLGQWTDVSDQFELGWQIKPAGQPPTA